MNSARPDDKAKHVRANDAGTFATHRLFIWLCGHSVLPSRAVWLAHSVETVPWSAEIMHCRKYLMAAANAADPKTERKTEAERPAVSLCTGRS